MKWIIAENQTALNLAFADKIAIVKDTESQHRLVAKFDKQEYTIKTCAAMQEAREYAQALIALLEAVPVELPA